MKKILYTLIPVFVIAFTGQIVAQTIKIMSFNVQQPYGTNWDGRKANAASIINTENPDIIGTQEAVVYMRDYLISNTSGYTSFGVARDGGDAGEASYIFYKTAKYTLDAANSGNFWMSNTTTVPSRFGGDYNRICTYVRLVEKATGKGFYHFNIHNYMPAEAAYRLSAAKLLAQKVAARAINDPVFITGDFNSSEGDAVTVWMKSGADNPVKCRDSYRDFDPTGSVTTGFGTKFDYIYYPNTDKYSTSETHVINSPVASDHFPIIATVKYSDNAVNPVLALSQTEAIYEGQENGKTISVTLSGAQFAASLNVANWTVANLPAGVSKGSIVRNSDTRATITLNGNSAKGTYLHNIMNITVTAGASQIVGSSGNTTVSIGAILIKAAQIIPGKIEAESYNDMEGIQLESCTDVGAGQNIGYLNANDWITYRIDVSKAGKYKVNYRTASQTTDGKLEVKINDSKILTQDLVKTGGWQTWSTTTGSIDLSQGVQELKFVVLTGDVNINWIEFVEDNVVVIDTGTFKLKAQTQNLWRRNDSWPNRLKNIVSMIKDQAPDYIAITEGDEGKAPELATLLTDYTLETGPWKEESTCIIYKKSTLTVIETGVFGYSSTPDVNKASDWGDGAVYNWLRKCNWILFEHKKSGKRFYVFNNHLDALNSTLGPAYWRIKQVELLTKRIALRTNTQYPFIVTGDLNEHETDGAITYLKSGAGNPVQMEDSYRQILPAGDGYTFGTIKLDYIFIQKNSALKATSANIVYQSQYGHLSDHNSIWATFTIGDTAVKPFFVPGKIQAENYHSMSGIQLENTTDTDGGKNIGFLSADDWFSYKINVAKAGKYKLDFRHASEITNGKLQVKINDVDIKTLDFTMTGGWQKWETATFSIDLKAGVQELKFKVMTGDFNINWIEFTEDTFVTGSEEMELKSELLLYPNPVKDILYIKNLPENSGVEILNILGVKLKEFYDQSVDISELQAGIYFVKIKDRVIRFNKY